MLKPNTIMSLQRLSIQDSLSRQLSSSFASPILGGCFLIGGVNTPNSGEHALVQEHMTDLLI